LQNLRGGDVWWATKFVKPQAGATIKALTDREDKQGKMTSENEKLLRCESFSINDGD
jgi:hypothetical protein